MLAGDIRNGSLHGLVCLPDHAVEDPARVRLEIHVAELAVYHVDWRTAFAETIDKLLAYGVDDLAIPLRIAHGFREHGQG